MPTIKNLLELINSNDIKKLRSLFNILHNKLYKLYKCIDDPKNIILSPILLHIVWSCFFTQNMKIITCFRKYYTYPDIISISTHFNNTNIKKNIRF